jgi:hypothetical protein
MVASAGAMLSEHSAQPVRDLPEGAVALDGSQDRGQKVGVGIRHVLHFAERLRRLLPVAARNARSLSTWSVSIEGSTENTSTGTGSFFSKTLTPTTRVSFNSICF